MFVKQTKTGVAMKSVTQIELAWALYQAGVEVSEISVKIAKHRSTVFRWVAGIELYGIREFLKRYKASKTRARSKQIDCRAEALLVERRKIKEQCGQKLRHWLKKTHGIVVSVATIYRILGKHFKLRSKWKKWVRRPALPRAEGPREVIQIDNIDLGELFIHNFIDTFTREVVSVVVLEKTAEMATKALEEAMDYFGSSVWIQTDNGSEYKKEFRPKANRYCEKLRQITPGQKEENGFVESFNRTLRKECVGWRKYKAHELDKLQAYVDSYLVEYHTERPHLSLNLMTPYEFIQSHLT
jgi:transposase InsO family protein